MGANDDLDLAKTADELTSPVVEDHAMTAVYAGLQALPFGSVVVELLKAWIPRRKEERLLEFVQALGHHASSTSERLDAEFVRTEEFADRVEDIVDRVTQRRSQAKTDAFAGLLATTATHDRLPYDETERVTDVLDRLTTSQMVIVVELVRRRQQGSRHMDKYRDLLASLPERRFETFYDDCRALEAMRLTRAIPGGGFFNHRHGIRDESVGLTDFGERFVDALRLDD
jgi:hypothetical protein